MTLGTKLILVAAGIAIAMSLAFLIDRVERRWKHRAMWKAIEEPKILKPTPDNVLALFRKGKV